MPLVTETPNTPLSASSRSQFFTRLEELRTGLENIRAVIAGLSDEQVAKLQEESVQERLGRIELQEDVAEDAKLTIGQLDDVNRKLRVLASCNASVEAVQGGSDAPASGDGH